MATPNDSESDPIQVMQDCLKLIKKYEWLTDSFVSNFFTNKIWENRIPNSWKEAIKNAQPSDLADLLDYEEPSLTYPWPLEIIVLRASVKHLAVPRKPFSKNDLVELLGAEFIHYQACANSCKHI